MFIPCLISKPRPAHNLVPINKATLRLTDETGCITHFKESDESEFDEGNGYGHMGVSCSIISREKVSKQSEQSYQYRWHIQDSFL